MERVLYIIVLILISFWIIGFFFYSLGAIIHLALLLAFIFLLIKLFTGKKRKGDVSSRVR